MRDRRRDGERQDDPDTAGEVRKLTTCFSRELASTWACSLPVQYVYESGLTRRGAVAVTQPRRVAAVSIARRVAAEKSVSLGQVVRASINPPLPQYYKGRGSRKQVLVWPQAVSTH